MQRYLRAELCASCVVQFTEVERINTFMALDSDLKCQNGYGVSAR